MEKTVNLNSQKRGWESKPIPSAKEADALQGINRALDPLSKENASKVLSLLEQKIVVDYLQVNATRAQMERYQNAQQRKNSIQEQLGAMDQIIEPTQVDQMAVTPEVYLPKEVTKGRDRILDVWIKNGRKTIKPTPEMCRAFENVELRLTFEQYQQPYMCLRVDLPNRKEPCWVYFGPNPPEIQDAPDRVMWFWTVYHTPQGEAGLCFAQKPEEQSDWTIERRLFDESDNDLWHLLPECRTIIRICLNCCLAATGFATRLNKPLCPHPQWPRKDRRAWEAEQPQVVEFIDQHIRWYDEEGSASEPGDGHHARPQTHWRKGHWRRQHFGKGRIEIRPVFIRPVLVNAAFFVGKPENTSVEIVGMPPVIRGGL